MNGDQAHRQRGFECTEVGWGQVGVNIEVAFKNDLGFDLPPFKLTHITKFVPQGETKTHTVKIPKELAINLGLVIRGS